jgi:hypothetical protein
MKCAKCGCQTDALFRANPLGEVAAIWVCRECALAVDPEVDELVRILRKAAG